LALLRPASAGPSRCCASTRSRTAPV
jgi:hypothetical protein